MVYWWLQHTAWWYSCSTWSLAGHGVQKSYELVCVKKRHVITSKCLWDL